MCCRDCWQCAFSEVIILSFSDRIWLQQFQVFVERHRDIRSIFTRLPPYSDDCRGNYQWLRILWYFSNNVGAYKYRFSMVWIYSIFCMVCFVLFLTLGIATVVHVPRFFDPLDDSKCTSTDTFTRFQTYA